MESDVDTTAVTDTARQATDFPDDGKVEAEVPAPGPRRPASSRGTKFLALCLLVGALFCALVALGMTVMGLLGRMEPIWSVASGAFFVLFAWTMVRAVGLWRGKPEGYRWSCFVFALQVFSFNISGIIFSLFMGANFTIAIGPTGFGSELGMIGGYQLFRQSDPSASYVGINLFAVAAAIYLYRQWQRRLALPA